MKSDVILFYCRYIGLHGHRRRNDHRSNKSKIPWSRRRPSHIWQRKRLELCRAFLGKRLVRKSVGSLLVVKSLCVFLMLYFQLHCMLRFQITFFKTPAIVQVLLGLPTIVFSARKDPQKYKALCHPHCGLHLMSWFFTPYLINHTCTLQILEASTFIEKIKTRCIIVYPYCIIVKILLSRYPKLSWFHLSISGSNITT